MIRPGGGVEKPKAVVSEVALIGEGLGGGGEGGGFQSGGAGGFGAVMVVQGTAVGL